MLEPQEGLPGRLAEARRDISEDAVACDFDRLEALAEAEGHCFTFTFGDADSPAAYWRQQEAAGGEPLQFLAGMLRSPHGRIPLGEGSVYVWPSSATFESWADVPPEFRDALRPLYRDGDFALFEEFGAYTATE